MATASFHNIIFSHLILNFFQVIIAILLSDSNSFLFLHGKTHNYGSCRIGTVIKPDERKKAKQIQPPFFALFPGVRTTGKQAVGVWGQRHKRYIKEYRPALYNALLLSGNLNIYLADIDQQAQKMLDSIIEQMIQAQGITEALKATDQMVWVGKMNNIRASAVEIVYQEIIYV